MSDSSRTTTSFLDALRDLRNAEAWQIFDGRYRPLVTAYALRRGLQHADAEDLAQITLGDFVAAYVAGQYDRERGRLRHWLGGLAARRVADWFRQRGREIHSIGGEGKTEFLNAVAAPDVQDQLWEDEWESYLLARCKEQIHKEFSAEYVQVFEEYILKGRPADEVARELSVTRNAIYICKTKLLARIREIRDEYECAGG